MDDDYINYFNLPKNFKLHNLYNALQNKLTYIDTLNINNTDKIFFKKCTIELYNNIIKKLYDIDVEEIDSYIEFI